ncbi:HNH endonuclease signature motif containing protein [Arthrobacter globiformis]|uniref:HNH endonuclease n=1 Tax=Arthrobacter globiformis TaxID=1665 RepID=A0A328HJU4_ARTGO|nr:HNH endonuclease signature motif containing protein [Arthrobacter globiformis]RAM38431.1 HNH endonuclease [Arthrobacter globiformis]
MEATGEDRADTAVGTDVSGLRAAALLRGRGLRSVPSAGSRSDTPIKDMSDGGAAAGSSGDSGSVPPPPGTPRSASAAVAPQEPASPPLATSDLNAALALLDSATSSAPEELAAANFLEAADFAELTEKLARRVEHLQVRAAGAVDRTRTEAINAAGSTSHAPGWTTGWGTEPEPAAATAGLSIATTTGGDSDVGKEAATPAVPARAVAWSPADDGARNTSEFLRTRLRISTPEARRRLALANATLPRTGLAGRPMPPEREETAAALTAGIISSRAGTTITTALDKVRHIPDPGLIAEMEHNLTLTAIENDHDFLTRIAHRWIDALDQDGTEPSEENLRHRQGVFLRHKHGGLHHLEIRATSDQYEVLTTVMNTATNPRTTTPDTTNCGSESSDEGTSGGDSDSDSDSDSDNAANSDSAAVDLDAVFNAAAPEPDLDRRTLAQQRLDGLVGASKAALAAGTLPTTGGLRPQVMVTINHRDLLNSIETAAAQGPRYNKNGPGPRPTDSPRPTPASWQATINPPTGPGIWQTNAPQPKPGTGTDPRHTSEPDTLTGNRPVTTFPGINWSGTGIFAKPLFGVPADRPTGSGTFTYTGPVTASTIRKIACDADIIPVLLGSEGRILDIGRTTRIFPPHIRKALNARDRGCAFPNCTIPASWCEAHHITYWSRGGPTSTDNGVLLCTHHHHLIHKEQWKIRVQNGIPWFIPPPHIDPRQQPRQNRHHKT